MIPNPIKNQHLLWRAGFGPSAGQLDDINQLSPSALFRSLQQASAAKPAFIDVTDDYLKGLAKELQEAGPKKQGLDKEERKNINQQTKYAIKQLNLYWLNEMVQSPAQLREKMAFFWHGHFATRNLNVFFQQGILDVIRQNALGSFRDLLHGVSKTPAMLNFLNANQNRKDHPNENFAREVMELFTMGRGHYTEQDIKEAARAFTGWGVDRKGGFMFRPFQHDNGRKTVLGTSGNFDGADVLDILLAQKQTARFIAQKIYRFYVNDLVDPEKTEWLADRFYRNNYNISLLLEDIFTSDWFFEEKHIGAKIKSPVELLVGIRRILPMEIRNEEAQLMVQRVLGQVLFYPPNVAGWPGGKNWIDSSTLMMRMRLPQLITDVDEFNVRPKRDDDQMMGKEEEGPAAGNKPGMTGGKPIRATIHWEDYLKHFVPVSREQLLPALATTLLQIRKGLPLDCVQQTADNSSRENFIRTATIQLMSIPEYQMC
ncbi:MAG: DUF1800 domain-containing protein [Flavisolibacter sp.]